MFFKKNFKILLICLKKLFHNKIKAFKNTVICWQQAIKINKSLKKHPNGENEHYVKA